MIEPSMDIVAQKEDGGGVKTYRTTQSTTLVERIFSKLPALVYITRLLVVLLAVLLATLLAAGVMCTNSYILS